MSTATLHACLWSLTALLGAAALGLSWKRLQRSPAPKKRPSGRSRAPWAGLKGQKQLRLLERTARGVAEDLSALAMLSDARAVGAARSLLPLADDVLRMGHRLLKEHRKKSIFLIRIFHRKNVQKLETTLERLQGLRHLVHSLPMPEVVPTGASALLPLFDSNAHLHKDSPHDRTQNTPWT